MRSATSLLLGLVLLVATAGAGPGDPFGGDDPGCVPPDSATAECEGGVLGALAKYADRVAKCQRKAALMAEKGRWFDLAACLSNPDTGKGAYEKFVAAVAALGAGCAGCAMDNADDLRAAAGAFLGQAAGALYCAGEILLGDDLPGLVPPDTGARKCAEKIDKAAVKHLRALLRCADNAGLALAAGVAFDLDGCQADAEARYARDVARLVTGCAGCTMTNAGAVGDLMGALAGFAGGGAFCSGCTDTTTTTTSTTTTTLVPLIHGCANRFWGWFGGTDGSGANVGAKLDPGRLRAALLARTCPDPAKGWADARIAIRTPDTTLHPTLAQLTKDLNNPDADQAVPHFKANVQAGDQFVFYFSGHGSCAGRADTAPFDEPKDSDGDPTDDQGIALDGGTLFDDDLTPLLSGFPAGVGVTVIIDACGAAGLVNGSKDLLAMTDAAGAYLGARALGFLGATSHFESATGVPGTGGVYTSQLVDGLANGGNDKAKADADGNDVITSRELADYAGFRAATASATPVYAERQVFKIYAHHLGTGDLSEFFVEYHPSGTANFVRITDAEVDNPAGCPKPKKVSIKSETQTKFPQVEVIWPETCLKPTSVVNVLIRGSFPTHRIGFKNLRFD